MATAPLITITGQIQIPPGTPDATAKVVLEQQVWLVHTDGTAIEPQIYEGIADSNGDVSFQVPACTHPDWRPVNWRYRVTFDGVENPQWSKPFRAVVPHDQGSLTLNDLVPVGPASEGSLYAPANHTHPTDVSESELTAALVPYAFDTDVDLKLDKTGGTVTGALTVNGGSTLLGVVQVGSKNSASNINLCGYYDITTQPTSGMGTWAVGDVVMTRLGLLRCTEAGDPGKWLFLGNDRALENGFTGWNYEPPAAVQGSFTPTSGLSYVFRFRAMSNVISSLTFHVIAPGTNITNAWASLHNDAGAVLGPGAKSANNNTAFQSGGIKDVTLNVGQFVVVGAYYKARLWVVNSGGTQPTMSRACSSASPIVNPAVGGTLNYASADGSLTDMNSAPDNIGAMTGIAQAVWAGAKP